MIGCMDKYAVWWHDSADFATVFVYWEAPFRYASAALALTPAGVSGDIGLMASQLGLADLAIGLA